jgi:hypothetical protein
LGWEGTSFAGQVFGDGPNPAFPAFQGELFDRLVDELGINRLRLEVRSGAENPRDWWGEWFLDGTIPRTEWGNHRYEIINDNADPSLAGPGGFHFSELDWTIENILLPIRERVQANGERLYVNLNYVDFGMSGFEHKDRPEEYAEFMSAAFHHMQQDYGFVPDAIEVILEPENPGPSWSGTQLGQALVATGDRLAQEGFHPDFIGPSSARTEAALATFDAMVAVPGVSAYLSEFAYHRYGTEPNADDPRLPQIAQRAEQYGLRTSMLERIGATHEALHLDLTRADASAWQQFALAAEQSGAGDTAYYVIDQSDPADPRLRLAPAARFLPQYFRFVREGATRIEASSDNDQFDPVAFVAADGGHTLVVQAKSAGELAIAGLPQGSYRIVYTSQNDFLKDLPSTWVATGQALMTSIPTPGVLTIYHAPAPGDYDNNGVVDQGDLDLVLLNWGADAVTPPQGWVSELPSGKIDQDELDGVLLNWGAGIHLTSPVPEPGAARMLIAGCLCLLILTCQKGAILLPSLRGHFREGR